MPSLNDPNNVAASKGDNIPRGIALIVTGLMIVPSIDAIAKHLAGSVSALQITWARFHVDGRAGYSLARQSFIMAQPTINPFAARPSVGCRNNDFFRQPQVFTIG